MNNMNIISSYLKFHENITRKERLERYKNFKHSMQVMWVDGEGCSWFGKKPSFWVYIKIHFLRWLDDIGHLYVEEGESMNGISFKECLKRFHLRKCRMEDYQKYTDYINARKDLWGF